MSKNQPRCVRCGSWLTLLSGPVGEWVVDVDAPCLGCAYLDSRRNRLPVEERCKGCGRALEGLLRRCEPCEGRHLEQGAQRREKRRREILSPSMQRQVLAHVAAGESLAEVARDLGTSQQRLWAAARLWPWWAELLDEALMQGRPSHIEHGRPGGYRKGCRCPECRQAKNEGGRWKGWRSDPR